MSQIPAGKTWFDTLKTHFSAVPLSSTDKGISTLDFLSAAESTTTLFDMLGSVAFTPVKSDMTGNITKIRTRYNASPANSQTLQELCKSELAAKSHTATEGLLWLVRGLDFTAQSLRADLTDNVGVATHEPKPKAELADCFRKSYKNTLAPHHGWMVKPIFSAAMSATPYRKDLYARMAGQGVEGEKVREELESWLKALEERVAVLKAFLASPEAKW
jgi:hypothetical protein